MPDELALNEIPDATPDDAYSAGDEAVDWSQVVTVDEQIAAIAAIDDPDKRLAAAKAWAAEMAATARGGQ